MRWNVTDSMQRDVGRAEGTVYECGPRRVFERRECADSMLDRCGREGVELASCDKEQRRVILLSEQERSRWEGRKGWWWIGSGRCEGMPKQVGRSIHRSDLTVLFVSCRAHDAKTARHKEKGPLALLAKSDDTPPAASSQHQQASKAKRNALCTQRRLPSVTLRSVYQKEKALVPDDPSSSHLTWGWLCGLLPDSWKSYLRNSQGEQKTDAYIFAAAEADCIQLVFTHFTHFVRKSPQLPVI